MSLMATTKAPFALTLLTVTVVSAALWEEGLSRCSTNCPLVENPKLNYDEGKIYSYSYSVKSQMFINFEGETETDWTSTVEMAWLTPCDMIIKFSATNIDGIKGPAAAGGPLERYPLVVALSDGGVQHVCSHPDDDVWAINIKKGVVSQIQNSLPSLSRTDSSLLLQETDVVGKCSTRYDTEVDNNKIIVRKLKDYKECQKHHPSTLEKAVTWLPISFDIQESRCQQEIANGIFTSTACTDRKVFYLRYGTYMRIEARQESTLQLQAEAQAPSRHTASKTRTELLQESLLYDQGAHKKDPSLVEELDKALSHICEKTNETVGPEVASLVAKTVNLLRLVPDEAVEQTLMKIRSGQYCTDNRKLESLFLDFVTFLYESSSVKVLVDELLSGRIMGSRATLYARSLCFISQPNAYALEALQPLMESLRNLPSATLCGASMVYTYCQQNRECQEEEPVKSIADILSHKLDEQCSSLNDEEDRSAMLGTLKALGNMGVITPEVSSSVIRCIENGMEDTGIQVAAVQAFRNAECGHLPTGRLMDFAMDSSLKTEVRIASYLAVIRCVGERELERIISKMLQEENTQVRSFILSHLVNLQKSSVPYKEPLKHLLSNVILPNNVDVDITKNSRNLDMSFSAPPLGVSAEIESNILYTPDSYIPRNLDINVITDLNGTSMNVVEIGTRLEGMEPMFEMISGAQNNHATNDYNQIFSSSSSLGDGSETLSELQQQTLRNIQFIEKKFEKPRVDAFVRVMGQEIYFASTSEDPRLIILGGIMQYVFSYGYQVLEYLLDNLDEIRAVQFQESYSVPTIQGIPFKFEGELTTVMNMKLTGLDELIRNTKEAGNILKIQPSLAVQAPVFFGYDSHFIKEGIHISSNISSNIDFTFNVIFRENEIEIQLDAPDGEELLYLGYQAYFMKKIIGLPEQNASPESNHFAHTWTKRCVWDVSGLYICLKTVHPDDHNVLFGGMQSLKVVTEKHDLSMKGYSLKIRIQDDERGHSYVLQANVIGDVRRNEITLTASTIFKDRSEVLSLLFDWYDVSGGVWLTIRNRGDQTIIEGDVKINQMYQTTKYGFMIEATDKQISRNEEEHKLRIFLSNSKNFLNDSQVFEGVVNTKSRGDLTSLYMKFNTMGVLQAYYVFSMEVDVDMIDTLYGKAPVPSRIRKFELLENVGCCQAESYIRKESDSLYKTFFGIYHRRQEIFSIWTNHSAEGRWQDEDASFKSYASVKYFGHPFYEISNEIFYGRNHTGMTVEVLSAPDGSEVAKFVGFFVKTPRMEVLGIP